MLKRFIAIGLALALLPVLACTEQMLTRLDDDDGDDDDSGTPIETNCDDCPAVGDSLSHMLCAIDICDDSIVAENTISAPLPFGQQCELEDAYEAVAHFGSTDNGLVPRLNGSYALLATGKANPTDLTHSDDCTHFSNVDGLVDPWIEDDSANVYDAVEWSITLTAPADATGFQFDYVFFSEEYDEYVSSQYNDKFYAVLNAPETTGGQDQVVNFTDCRDPYQYYDFTGPECTSPSGYCCYMTVNSGHSDCCWYPHYSDHVADSPALAACPAGTDDTTDITGTGYECAHSAEWDGDGTGSSTGWVRTSWPIQPSETFTLTFHIHDTFDSLWDSEVILDAFQFVGDPTRGSQE